MSISLTPVDAGTDRMTFNSLSYFIFLPVLFIAFAVVGTRYRWIVLLLASYIFYGFLLKPALLVVLTLVILITFWLGKLISNNPDPSKRKWLLWTGVIANLSLLVYFKYIPFLTENLNLLFGILNANVSIHVPQSFVSIGLSFFIFQAISYLADIYFRITKPEPHIGYFALYLGFFPKLLQGPIERAKGLLPQLKEPYRFDYAMVRNGLYLFAWGLFKKVVVADRLGILVDSIYSDVHSYSGLSLLVATYCYAFQIYYDFSGYTDMALGTASLFNIRLTQNFNRPYLATSIADFWRRWHISFCRWILDYIFEPLQMRWREWGVRGTAAALIVTFLASGIWHGASWGYIVWGGLHGVYLVISIFWKPYQKKLHKYLGLQKTLLLKVFQILLTFQLVCFTYIFFRASTLADALYIIKESVTGVTGDISRIMTSQVSVVQILFPGQLQGEVLLILCLMVMIAIFSAIERSQSPNTSQIGGFAWLSKVPLPIRISIYAGLLYMFAIHGASTQSFIYMQF